MELMIEQYIEKQINDIEMGQPSFNYSYCCGALGALFVTGSITLEEYNTYTDKADSIRYTKPKEEP